MISGRRGRVLRATASDLTITLALRARYHRRQMPAARQKGYAAATVEARASLSGSATQPLDCLPARRGPLSSMSTDPLAGETVPAVAADKRQCHCPACIT